MNYKSISPCSGKMCNKNGKQVSVNIPIMQDRKKLSVSHHRDGVFNFAYGRGTQLQAWKAGVYVGFCSNPLLMPLA